MIKLIRCDERLIHGQCMTQIVKVYEIQDIIVVDDETAGNDLLKRIFRMAVPPSMNASVYTVEASIPKIQEAITNNRSTLILMKTPDVLIPLLDDIQGLPKDLNIASLSKRKSSSKIIEIVPATYFKEEEFNAVCELERRGVHIWLRMIPNSLNVEWADIKDKITKKFAEQ